MKKERVWDVVAPLGASSLRLSSLTIRQRADVVPPVSTVLIDEGGDVDEVAAAQLDNTSETSRRSDIAQEDPELSYRRDKAMWILIVSVKDDLVAEISEFEDPRDAWSYLQRMYEVCDVTRKLHLKSRLLDLRVTDDGGIEQYLREFKMIRSQLISIGQPLPEEDTVEILLNALPDSYESFITALNGTGEVPPLDVQVGRIQHMESRRALKYNSKDSDEALFVRTKRFSRPPGSGPDSRASVVICHYCGKRGHYLNQCRERESDIKRLDDDKRQKF